MATEGSFERALYEAWSDPPPAPRCPSCGREMTKIEDGEQGACNDCHEP